MQTAIDITRYSSVVQTRPHPDTSEMYRFVPTTEAIRVLADEGWEPVKIQESGVRKLENWGYQRHLIRLEHPDLGRSSGVGDIVPQMVLTNSHKGDAAFHLVAGLYVLVCGNGLVLPREGWGGQRVPHVGYAYGQMLAAVRTFTAHVPKVVEARERWGRIAMDTREMLDFAARAVALRFDSREHEVNPAELLHFRPEQSDGTLWSVFNACEEAVIRGGAFFTRSDRTTGRSRRVNGIDDTLRLNQELWKLAEETARRLS